MSLDIQVFREKINGKSNIVYDFVFLGSKRTKYRVEIEIDELNDDFLEGATCECPDFRFRQRECKHLIHAINILSDAGIKLRWGKT